MMAETPPSTFAPGQRVRVRINEHNRTPHEGIIHDVVWHHKNQQHNYYLEENGKKISKRYYEHDLDRVDAPLA